MFSLVTTIKKILHLLSTRNTCHDKIPFLQQIPLYNNSFLSTKMEDTPYLIIMTVISFYSVFHFHNQTTPVSKKYFPQNL